MKRSTRIWVTSGICLGLAVASWAQDRDGERRRRLGVRERVGGLTAPTLGMGERARGPRASSPAPRTVVPPGAYALSLDADLELGGFVFKDGYPLLHTDGGYAGGNIALGFNALVSATPPAGFSGTLNTALGHAALTANTTGGSNTAVGYRAMALNDNAERNTAVGAQALTANVTGTANAALGSYSLYFNQSGSYNVAVGPGALYYNYDGGSNIAVGSSALLYNTSGYLNTAIGFNALMENTTGNYNIGIGYGAGIYNTTGSSNISIASYGGDESNTLRIGVNTGTGDFELNRAFINGIRGITTDQADAIAVLIDSNGQLGTVSSSRRFKEDIRDIGATSAKLHELRPVAFRYRKEFDGGEKPVRYGLIAEEVAEVFPDLVAYDDDGQPSTVLYHLLDAMVLNELQRQEREIEELRARNREFEELRARLEVLEAAGDSG